MTYTVPFTSFYGLFCYKDSMENDKYVLFCWHREVVKTLYADVEYLFLALRHNQILTFPVLQRRIITLSVTFYYRLDQIPKAF